MFSRRARRERALRKALAALPPGASEQAIGALLAAFQDQGGSSSLGQPEDDLGAARVGSEQSDGEQDATSAVSMEESRRAKLKASALKYTGSADMWEMVSEMARWDGETLLNEGEIVAEFHSATVQQNPPPQARPSGEQHIQRDVGDYERMFGAMTGHLPEGKALEHGR